MLNLNPTLTTAGLALFVGDSPGFAVEITDIAFGSQKYDPSGLETALHTEIARYPIDGHAVISPSVMQVGVLMTNADPSARSPNDQWIGEIGFYAGATLFAVMSHAQAYLFYKSPDIDIPVTYVLDFSVLPPGSITVNNDALSSSIALAASYAQTASAAAQNAMKVVIERSYGVFANDPLTRPDGSARQNGDEYFNSTIQRKKQFAGAAWAVPDLDAAASAAAAKTSEANAGLSSMASQTAKTQAEAARDAAQLSAGIYATTAAGIAATTAGKYFSVPSADANEYLILYLNSAGMAVEKKRYYSVNAMEPDNVPAVYELSFRDSADNMAMGVTPSGEVEIPKIKATGGTLKDVVLERATMGGATVQTEMASLGLVLAMADEQGNVALGVTAEGGLVIPGGTTTLEDSVDTAWAITDAAGNMALGVSKSGGLQTPGAVSEIVDVPGVAWAVTDAAGNVAIGVDNDGKLILPGLSLEAPVADTWVILSIGLDDSIAHIGDSYTASHYVLKDKAYLSQLSALSPYRHQQFGVSGNDSLDMQYRIVNGTSSTGLTFTGMKPRYAFITSLANDGNFWSAKTAYYMENMRRLIETVKAEGVEPVITTEFFASNTQHAMLRRLADEYGCAFIDCTTPDAEIGGLIGGPFHQGHPGTRTGGVFWLPMLDFIDRMPKPTRAIKVYRRRSTFAVAAIADLLYKDRVDRNKKWKELTVAHYALDPQEKFEELNQLGTFGYLWQSDEYQKLAAGTAVPVADYALIEVTLPGTAVALEAVEITLAASAAATVYVRNYLDVAASLIGKAQGNTPADATYYLPKWDKPRGAWRSLGVYTGPITIAQASLKNSMQGDKLVIMVAGSFNLTNLQIRYKGREVKSDLRITTKRSVMGAELLTQPLCGTAGQLAGWVTAGTPTTLIPIDNYNSPRKPGTLLPVDGVCTIDAAKTMGQVVVLPADTGKSHTFRLTAWARYFPKAFLNPALYPTLDAAQIIDRIANPASAPITSDTADLRTLKCEVWDGAGAIPAPGGAEFFDFAALQWRPVEFDIELPPYRSSASVSFRLSCPDGEIQISKVSFKEVSL